MATTLSHSRNPSSTPNPNLASTSAASSSSSSLFPPPPPHRRTRMSTPAAPNPPSSAPRPQPPHNAGVIDLTEISDSSPVQHPPNAQILGRFPHLSFPNSNQANSVAGPSNSRNRSGGRGEEITLSSDSDDAGGGGGGGNGAAPNRTRARRSTRRTRGNPTNDAGDDDDDDIVIVSQRPAVGNPLPPPFQSAHGGILGQPIGFGRFRQPASPPPYILPPSASSSSSRPRTRATDHTDPESTRLAAQLAAEESSNYSSSNPAAYLQAQQAAMNQATGARGYGGYILRAGGSSGGGAQGSGGGIAQEDALEQLLSQAGAAGFVGDRRGYMDQIYAAIGSGVGAVGIGGRGMFGGLFEGGLQGLYGGGYGGAGGYGGGAGPSNAGWGGAAKVRAASRKYGVRMSHPLPIQKGFSRDIIEPSEEEQDQDRDQDSQPSPAKKSKKGKEKERERDLIIQELEPVCASCLEGLRMGSEGKDGKVWGLGCGHVVCGKCLREAKERSKGGWRLNVDEEEEEVRRSPKKGKGKKRVIEDEGEDQEMRLRVNVTDNEEEDDLYAPPSDQDEPLRITSSSSTTTDRRLLPVTASKSKKGSKGKSEARVQDESLEIDENWTLCPVRNCEAKKGNDLLAEEGWNKPFELYA